MAPEHCLYNLNKLAKPKITKRLSFLFGDASLDKHGLLSDADEIGHTRHIVICIPFTFVHVRKTDESRIGHERLVFHQQRPLPA